LILFILILARFLEDVDIAESGFLNEITGLFNRFIRWG